LGYPIGRIDVSFFLGNLQGRSIKIARGVTCQATPL
jgi:hypothetical protein